MGDMSTRDFLIEILLRKYNVGQNEIISSESLQRLCPESERKVVLRIVSFWCAI